MATTNITSSANGKQMVEVNAEIGHHAAVRGTPTKEGCTHDWIAYVKFDRNEIVEKVEFILHPSFKNPKRVVKSAPFQVVESGYGGFMLRMIIYFKMSKLRQTIPYDYYLFLGESNRVSNKVLERFALQGQTSKRGRVATKRRPGRPKKMSSDGESLQSSPYSSSSLQSSSSSIKSSPSSLFSSSLLFSTHSPSSSPLTPSPLQSSSSSSLETSSPSSLETSSPSSLETSSPSSLETSSPSSRETSPASSSSSSQTSSTFSSYSINTRNKKRKASDEYFEFQPQQTSTPMDTINSSRMNTNATTNSSICGSPPAKKQLQFSTSLDGCRRIYDDDVVVPTNEMKDQPQQQQQQQQQTSDENTTAKTNIEPRIEELIEIQKMITSLTNVRLLKKVIAIIKQSGYLVVNNDTVDFDLVQMDDHTIGDIKKCLNM
ncbi:hypothetical protein HELRODRAFT_176701 [Helobdella robusta]|uniref:YEATS domain-containing protein n=1 Tax=Helobdella robusta TaxID=6412 RepID=T1FAT0_HELRO|nr:hypothetical protein HELRODRAFT_176701 [Helobdella robusta]ESN99535.1 hypothetical protein HELRODRAFT_176701 [Helobdella robusta]